MQGPATAPGAPSELLWTDLEQSPQDTWDAIKDLWLRLAQHLPVRVEAEGFRWRVVVEGLRCPGDDGLAQLRAIALDPGRYRWRWEGRSGTFVRSIYYEIGDLVFTVASIPTVVCWPQGDDLGWQVKGLLARLRARQGDGRREVPS